MKRRLVPVLTALATLTAVVALALPAHAATTVVQVLGRNAHAATTVVQVLGRNAVTYTSYPFDPTPTSKWASSSQGEFIDTNGNGIADSLRGRGADLEDFGIIRFREDYVRLQVLRGTTWVTRLANETDVVTAQTRAYGIIYTPSGLVCRTDPSLTDTYRVEHSVLFRRTDNVIGRRTLDSHTFTARLLATDPACPETPPPPPPPSADLRVVKTASETSVASSVPDTFTYTIAVANLDGTDNATSVTVTDTLPAEVDLTATGLPANCTLDSDPAEPDVVTCNLGTVFAGQTETITLGVVSDPAGLTDGAVTNTARVVSSTDDPNLANNTSTISIPIRPLADVSVTKTATQTSVTVPGDTFRYVLSATNSGPSDATAVLISDVIPAGLTVNEATLPTGCAYNAATRVLTCTTATLAAGATVSYSIDVTTNADRADDTAPYVNTARVATATYEVDTADNTDTLTIPVSTV